MFKSIVLLIVLFITLRCSGEKGQVSSCENLSFSENEIYHHIKSGDASYVKCLINSLADSALSDCDFANRVFSISDHLNFMYCGIDCEDKGWLILTRSRKDSTRLIITTGLRIYQKSPLFMSKVGPVNCTYGNVYSFCDPQILSDEEFRESFRNELQGIFQHCPRQ